MSYTKGPWQWLGPYIVSSQEKQRIVIAPLCDRHMATLATTGDDGLLVEMKPDHPNALLICAAQDLLEACKIALKESEFLNCAAEGLSEKVETALKEAIRKAEGK